LLSKSIEKKLE
jgi:hypothetical protein